MSAETQILGLAAVIGAMGTAAFKFLIDLYREERQERIKSDQALKDGVAALTNVSATNGELTGIVRSMIAKLDGLVQP